MAKEPRSRRERILRAASRLIGRDGYRGASMDEVAREAGVSKGLLHYHFGSKGELLIQAQRATFEQLHGRFRERASRGERGLDPALDALDAMWRSVRSLQGGAAFIVQTLAISAEEGPLREPMSAFYQDSTALLEDGISALFADQLDRLAVEPARMAVLIRILLEGLVVELSRARSREDLAAVDQAYNDMRELFRRFVLAPDAEPLPALSEAEPMPLPW